MERDNATPAEQTITPSRLKRMLELAGSFYGVALIVVAIAVVAFVWLADEVLEQEFATMNRDVLLWVHSFGSPTWDRLVLMLTTLGSVVGLTIMTLTLAALFLRYRRHLDAITLLAVMVGGGILSMVLKLAFRQIRPQVFPPLLKEVNFSFPSGHSLMSFCLWGFIAVWLLMQAPREPWRWLVAMVCLAIAALVALSRLYIGVHWPTDIVAGMVVATFWVTACFLGQRFLIERRQRRSISTT